ncbi:MAG: NPCBM/NEW2 domain-containing protein [Deltaproteobacteria bacterium]|nr:NPCBM/NEW2 domain-containing protein [Deltaproteobacteria bacterium]
MRSGPRIRLRRTSLALLAGVLAFLALASPAGATFLHQRYEGAWTSLPDFLLLTPVSSALIDVIGPDPGAVGGEYGLVITNTINVPTAGTYTFYTRSDAGSRLLIDGQVVVDNDGLHPPTTVEGSRVLDVGDHSIRIEYFATPSGATLEVGYRTGIPVFEPIPVDGRLTFMSSNPASIGSWGPVIPWPEIAISAAVLPDGKILTWSSTEIDGFPEFSELSRASVFDPATGTFVPVDNDFHDMFCAGVATLENGTIVAAGGNPSDRRVSSFNPATQTWSPLADMIDLRWYGLAATLPDNTVFASFAKDAGSRTEVYNPATNTWSPRYNADADTQLFEQNVINVAPNPTGAIDIAWNSHIAVTPQGDVFQGGPTPTWHRYDPMGGAATVALGQPIGDVARSYGNAVTYGEGKVLLVGGADLRLDPPTSRNFVYRVDLTGPAPTVTPGAPMRYPRTLLNTVTLANGELLVIGGNTVARYFDDTGSVLHTEIYSPSTDSWRTTDNLDVPRNYHSTALLMKDGRVIAMGGGGRWSGHPANHLDGQIFSPPYLFESDGSPAVRPMLSVPAPAQVRAGDSLVVTASPTTTAFSVVRLSAVTHHVNTDQRFLPISAVANGDGTFTLQFPANPNTLIVGPYFLFALDADGTPSIGETIQVVRDVQSVPDPTSVYVSDLPWTTSTNGLGPAERDRSNGDAAAGDGAPIRLAGVTYAKGVGAHAFSEISVALDGRYDRFRAQIGLDDAQDGLCGEVQFEVALDGVVAYTSSPFVDTTPTESLDLDVGTANALTLRIFTLGDACGDRGDWADARLVPKPAPGFRYYRFRPTKLRNDATANGIQLAELALFEQGVRRHALFVTNPGGNNPAGQGPTRADDADAGTQWRDFNRGDLVYDMGARVEIDAYVLTTASDAPERDPVRWLLEASIDGVIWNVLDDRSTADYPTPPARGASTPDLPIVIAAPITPLPFAPRHSTTLLVEKSSGADRIWNVNPDNDSVTVSSASGTLLAEIPVGDRPWSIAREPGQARVYVVNKGSASISVIDAAAFTVDRTIALPRGSEPHGLVFAADASTYYVVLEAAARVEKRLAATDALVGSLALSGRPRHVSIRNDDARLLVSNFITPPIPGESTLTVDVAAGAAQVFSIDPATMTLDGTIGLTHDGRAQSESQGPGMPNYLGPAVVDFAGQHAYVPSKKDNVRGGALRGVAGMGFDSTVRANTSRIVLATATEDPTLRIDHDNSSLATGAALSGDDRYLFVTLETSRQLAVYDLQDGYPLMRLPTGRAPQSVALSSDGRTAYVHDFMDRQISRFDLTQMLETNLPATNLLPPIQTVSVEALPPTILLGKQLFYDAADDRIALDDYMSCASCHNDGDGDGRVWDLGGYGEGLRNTIDLRGKGTGHGRPHWTGNFDEIQDFESQIRGLNLGSGLLAPADFAATSAPLGPPKAGLSADLDALAAYVSSLATPPASPFRPSLGTLGADAADGRLAFAELGCLGCHSVPSLTDSPTTLRHDVGTIKPSSGERLDGPLDGFDTPGLVGAWSNPPFLHDGSAPTLEAAITAHSAFANLAPATLARLAAFLREAEPADLVALVDTDADGLVDLADPAPTNPCIPTTFVAVCGADADGDGVSDFQEGATADADGDGLFDYQESSTADADSDGVPDQSDPANGDACVPNAEACGPPPAVPIAGPVARVVLLGLLLATGLGVHGRRRSV